mmetsp:Transcript_25538/g.46547  ORF Transcript_25538/g.46547 Transcript_25538/m.46547 type:complete len:357 (-) Transcript_25538:80-1150(-)
MFRYLFLLVIILNSVTAFPPAIKKIVQRRPNTTLSPSKIVDDTPQDRIMANTDSKSPNTSKLYLRGLISNSFGGAILWALSTHLKLGYYVKLAVGLQLAVFLLHGLPNRSEKFYDLSGSATHFLLVAACLCRETKVRSARQVLASLCSTVWMTRLGTFLFTRISRDGKDGRFDAITPAWLSFLGAWTLQATWVVLTQLPIILLNDKPAPDLNPLGLVDALGFGCWVVGFAVEFLADLQKFTFRCDPTNKDKFLTKGLWRFSRHPNYFGEISMWCGLALVTSVGGAAGGNLGATPWFAWLSPAFTSLLLLKVSGVPMVEQAGMKKWGGDKAYLAYTQGTSCIVPWFPAKNAESEKVK